METKKPSLGEILIHDGCWQIPAFQRSYTWTTENAHNLISDLFDLYEDERLRHWVGVTLTTQSSQPCAKKGELGHYSHKCQEVIDGQQRLTTLYTLALAIDHHHFMVEGVPLSVRFQADFYLQSANQAEIDHIRLHKVPQAANSGPIHDVYRYFRWVLWRGADAIKDSDQPIEQPKKPSSGTDVLTHWQLIHDTEMSKPKPERNPALMKGTRPWDCERLIKVLAAQAWLTELEVDSADGDAVGIFRALNGNRMELNEWDHFRNNVFHEITQAKGREAAERLFTANWAPAEKLLDEFSTQAARGTAGGAKVLFLYDYLMQTGFRGRLDRGSCSGAARGNSAFRTPATTISWIKKDMHRAIERWCYATANVAAEHVYASSPRVLVPKKCRRVIDRIKQLSKQPAVPLLTLALDRYSATDEELSLTKEELLSLLIKIEKLVGTMVIDGKLTLLRSRLIRELHKWNSFKNSSGTRACELMCDAVDAECISPDKLASHLLNDHLQGTAEHPEGVYRNVDSGGILAIFDAIEEHLSGPSAVEISNTNSYWVEHVLPQEPSAWTPDFESWGCSPNDAFARVHNIGNLVPLTSRTNQEITNKTLAEKKRIIGEAREPDVKVRTMPEGLNQDTARWTANEIDERAKKLVAVLKARWYGA